MNRSLYIYAVFSGVVLSAFLVFVSFGWPGEIHHCALKLPLNSCFCEHFDMNEALHGDPGVRQPVNTWSNLYALITGLIVALGIRHIRAQSGTQSQLINSRTSWVPELYVVATVFLGLGSIWMHGSIKEWGGYVDGGSMYVFMGFLVFYSIYRLTGRFYWAVYWIVVLLFTVTHYAFPFDNIIILVVAYFVLEIAIGVHTGSWFGGSSLTRLLWGGALLTMGVAYYFWSISQTGGVLCDPMSCFQPHGLIWHVGAGVVSVLLYFFWRNAQP